MAEKEDIKSLLNHVLESYEGDKTENTRNYTPVSPRDFFISRYYSGFGREDIYDFWVEEAIDFIEGGYNELILTGSLGSGKSTVANLIFMYKVYELFSWRSVNKYLMVPDIQEIYNIYFSVSRTQAARTGFSQLRSMVDGSQWFKKNKPRDTKVDSILKFNEGLFSVFSGSNHQHAIGMTIWSFILDEADFFKRGSSGFDESYSSITEMYQELVDRRISRFQKFGKDYSFSILISSASYQSSFVSKRIDAAVTDPRIKVVKAVGYKIKPKGTYSDEKFIVFIGQETVDPEIITDNAVYSTIANKLKIDWRPDLTKTVQENFQLIPPQFKTYFEDVPIEFKKGYETNLAKSLMNHSGVYTAKIGKLFQSKALLLNAYKEELQHPFTKIAIELSTEDKIELKDYFLPSLLTDINKPHALHVDQSTGRRPGSEVKTDGDSTGISMFRYDGMVVEGNITKRIYTQVFSLEIKPPPPPFSIKISKVRDFIIFLFQKIGVNIVKVTYDQFQSYDSLQILQELGINACYQSVDKNDDPFIAWMTLLLDNCVNHYKHPLLEKEAFDAIHNRRKRKVDHPSDSTIDVLQSAVGALFNLVTMELDSGNDDTYIPDRRPIAEKEVAKVVNFGEYTDNVFKTISDRNKKDSFHSLFD